MAFEVGHKKIGGIEKGYKYDYTLSALKESLSKDKDAHNGETILDYFIKKAREDNKVLVALIKKILPDLRGDTLVIEPKGAWATLTPAEIAENMTKSTVGDIPDGNR